MVFFDWASTSPVVKYPCSNYGPFMNVNANYAYKEKKLLKECEDKVKKAIGVKSGKVIFGGTSSQLIENLFNAMQTNYYACDIICSAYEHESFFRYQDDSVKTLVELKGSLLLEPNDRTPFIVWQGVNNITGEIFPVKQIGELVHKYNGFYICDGTAQIGHTPIEPNIDDWCDFWCCSGHKLGTELGIGCCWVSNRLDKWLNGFKLHGTPNLAGALALTQAVEDNCDEKSFDWKEYNWGLYANIFYNRLSNNKIKYQIVPTSFILPKPLRPFNSTYAINAIRLPGFNANALQQYLASKQIYVSIGGSACAEKHDYRVLNAYGLSNDEANEVIRVSFGEDSSVEDVEALVEGIKEFQHTYC